MLGLRGRKIAPSFHTVCEARCGADGKRKTVSTVFCWAQREKPLKRLAHVPPVCTGLKSGVNAKLLEIRLRI